MKRIFTLFLLSLLTTCTTLASPLRIPEETLETALLSARTRELFPGVVLRVVEIPSAPLRAYVLHISPSDRLEWVITPPETDPQGWVRPRTVTDFARQYQLDLAFNASFFQRRLNDERVRPLGLWRVNGISLVPPHPSFCSLGLTQERKLVILDPGTDDPNLLWAIGGGQRLLRSGQITVPADDPQPRTAIGITADETLILVVVDGRQDQSRGLGLADLAQLLRLAGAMEGVNLDGGGSSTLVARMPSGDYALLNSPWDHRIYGGERAVATHLGFRILSP